MKKILVIGESCHDVYQYGESNRLAPEAPVPVFNKGAQRNVTGGMAMNVYNNIKSISNHEVTLLTNKNYEDITKTRFVDTRTNYVILRLDENDENYERINVRSHDYSKFDAVVISDYNKGFLTKDEISYIANNSNVSFLDTKKLLGSWVKKISYIKINDFEYERTKERIDDEIRKKLIITCGPSGAKYLDQSFPVPKVEIKDTSGAGDTFIAGLVSNYINTGNIKDAIRFANECATIVVQKKGVNIR